MNKFWTCVLLSFSILAITSCQPPAANNATANTNTNTNSNSNAKPAAAAPTKESLLALENKAFEAWGKKDGKFFEDLLTDNFVTFSPTGVVTKADTVKMIAENNCEMGPFTISDGQMTAAGPDVALHTFKADADVTCEGKKLPPTVWAASIYVRSGDAWKAVYHNEAPVPDPKAPPPPPAKKVELKGTPESPADPLTEQLLAVEKAGWEAWKARDRKLVEEGYPANFVALGGTGRTDKAATVKAWYDSKCDIKSYSLSNARATSVTPTVAFLTFRADATGTCDGNPLQSLWGTTLMTKEGDKWTPLFYMDTM